MRTDKCHHRDKMDSSQEKRNTVTAIINWNMKAAKVLVHVTIKVKDCKRVKSWITL